MSSQDQQSDIVRGECRQLLTPEEVDNYSVGIMAEFMSTYGWYVTVIKRERDVYQDDYGPLWRIRKVIDRLNPFGPCEDTYDVLVWNPDFEVGDTVRLKCDRLQDWNQDWYVHPHNPVPINHPHTGGDRNE